MKTVDDAGSGFDMNPSPETSKDGFNHYEIS
jgi:hypothetical protein